MPAADDPSPVARLVRLVLDQKTNDAVRVMAYNSLRATAALTMASEESTKININIAILADEARMKLEKIIEKERKRDCPARAGNGLLDVR